VGLEAYLDEAAVRPDLLLCAGDICDKADEVALTMTWSDLAGMAERLGARLIATAGNHDLDSRHKSDLDPRGVLYDLEPPFPALNTVARDEYWAKNFSIIDGPADDTSGSLAWRVVTMNSSAFHGYIGVEGPELDHGRVSPRTSRRLRAELAARPNAQLSILLIHHHLVQLPNVDLKEHSRIRDGEELAQLLESEGPWLVVHGHKHRARILFAHGEGSSATIFAAGSMSAYPYGQVAAAGVTNQAYVLRFASEDTLEQLQLGVAAQFETLSWGPGRGWRLANQDLGLPGRGGFGWRTDTRRLANKIAKKMKDEAATQLKLDELLDLEPRIAFLSPAGVDGLWDSLARRDPGIALRRSEHGQIESVNVSLQLDAASGEPTPDTTAP
jgi:predicted phosphodiesterase